MFAWGENPQPWHQCIFWNANLLVGSSRLATSPFNACISLFLVCGGGDGVEDEGDARPRGGKLHLGTVPRGPQGSGEPAREALARERAAISTSTVIDIAWML